MDYRAPCAGLACEKFSLDIKLHVSFVVYLCVKQAWSNTDSLGTLLHLQKGEEPRMVKKAKENTAKQNKAMYRIV